MIRALGFQFFFIAVISSMFGSLQCAHHRPQEAHLAVIRLMERNIDQIEDIATRAAGERVCIRSH